MKLVTSELIQKIDREAINNRGIPSEQLMENAGRGIAEQMADYVDPLPDKSRVAIFCGKGNNGGDGYVVGRYLHQWGHDVTIYFMGPIDKLSNDARLNYDRALAEKIAMVEAIKMVEISSPNDLPETIECDIIVDAIFGTGFSGAPRGLSADIIEHINSQDAVIVSVDMPSGLNANNGTHEGNVVAADFTFTLAQPKYGLYLSPGRELAGTVFVVPIGIPDDDVAKFEIKDELITPDSVSTMLPFRKPDGHKGDFGKLMVLAGSTGMTGAAALAGESALRSGCGLCKVACPKTVQPVLATKMTEVMTYLLPDVAKKGALALRGLGEIRKLLDQHDAVAIGPGIGTHHETGELIRRLISTLDKPAVVDADGLNALSGHTDILKDKKAPLVLTPHPGEFRRLWDGEYPEEFHDRTEVARQFASTYGVILVLKGSPTIVADPNGRCFVNQSGNSGMATGGSGDVLTGIIGSFLAQGMAALDAAIAGVFIHGLAGDIAANDLTERAMIASDMTDALPEVFELLECAEYKMAIEVRRGVRGKYCSSCKVWKPLTEFHKDSSHRATQGGRHCRCKPCYKAGRKRLGY